MKSKIVFIFFELLFILQLRSQWVNDNIQTPNYFFEYVAAVDSSRAWAIGHYASFPDSSFLFRRTDKSPWAQHFLQIANNSDFTCIAAQDSDKVWIGTKDGKVYFSSYNNNKTVLQLDPGGESYINDIKFSRSNKKYGYVYCDPPNGKGTPFKIFKTSNYGDNWIEYSPVFGGSYLGALASMCVTDSDHVWLGLNCQQSGCLVPKIAYTSNGGINWQVTAIPNGSNYVSAIVFKNDNLFGIAAPWDQTPTFLFKSVNGANSWSFLYDTQLQQPVNSLCWAMGTNTWFFCSNEETDQIKKSSNDGTDWENMTLPSGTGQVISMDIITEGRNVFGYAVTSNGRILRLMDSAKVISIHNISNDVPSLFRLYQNYPNPFNPSTMIAFDIPKDGYASLKIFNTIGQEVAVLIDGNIKSGVYQKVFNASDLPSGIYFYKFISDGFSEVRKMSLIK